MKPKQYKLVVPEQREDMRNIVEAVMKRAVLLSLLERKDITYWQYEQCCSKFYRSTKDSIMVLKQ